MLDIDRLLSSHHGFVLGERLRAARALGHSEAEARLALVFEVHTLCLKKCDEARGRH